MKFLTSQEQRVLAIVMFLLLVGWAVQMWDESQTPRTALPVSKTPERAQE